VSDYLAHEGLEHAERAHEHLAVDAPPLLRLVPLAAAILAVLAGLSSLYGNRLAEAMVRVGSDALLDQSKAADAWNEYEAQSLKKHLANNLALVSTDPSVKRRFAKLESTYEAREKPLGVEAKSLEKERTAAIERLDRLETKKLRSDVATALFQIAIVLSSIGALTKQSTLFLIGLAGALVGLVFCVLGLVP